MSAPQQIPASTQPEQVLVNQPACQVTYTARSHPTRGPTLEINIRSSVGNIAAICNMGADLMMDLLGNYYGNLASQDHMTDEERLVRFRPALLLGEFDAPRGRRYLCQGVVQAPPTLTATQDQISTCNPLFTGEARSGFMDCLKLLYTGRILHVRLHLNDANFSDFSQMEELYVLVEQVAWTTVDLYPCDVFIVLTLVVNTPCQRALASLVHPSPSIELFLTMESTIGVTRPRAAFWKELTPDEPISTDIEMHDGLELVKLLDRLQIRMEARAE